MEVGIQLHTEKTKCMVVSLHQNAGQNHNLLIANISFETGGKVQVLENKSNKSKLRSGRNSKKIKYGKCLPLFCFESVFPFPL